MSPTRFLFHGLAARRAVSIVALALAPFGAMAKFDAVLEGQSAGSTTWVRNNLQGWRELDFIPVRVYLSGGPANNQTITVDFDHFRMDRPGIEDLTGFLRSSNVVITAGPTLVAPPNETLWSYTFTVNLTDNKPGFVEFRARLAAGSHVNTGSSLHLRGETALGTLQIHKPGPAAGVPDLTVLKNGPATANAGETITYVLSYSNKTTAATGATGVQVTDVLPSFVTYVTNSSPGAHRVGNILTWDVGSLARGASGSISFRAVVHAGVTNGQRLENNAAIYSAENDANLADNTSRFITTVSLNRAPEASHDSYITDEDTTLSVTAPGVLSNDRDLDGNNLTAILINTTSHGTLSLSPNGAFVYRPNTNYNGPDSFTYKANDGRLDSGPATVNIAVRPINDRPIARDEALTLNEDTEMGLGAPGVLANDTDVEGSSLRAVLVTSTAHGRLTLAADGSFLYKPDANYYGPDAFTYSANDGTADSSIATVAITVVPVNDPPSFTKGPDQAVPQNSGARTIANWARNISPGPANEAAQTVAFAVTANSNPSLFSAQPAISPAGTLTFASAAGAHGTAMITLVLRDNGGTARDGVDTSAPQTFSISVNAPPSVSLVLPTNGTVFVAPADITLIAEPRDVDGTISDVDFFQGTNYLGEAKAAPYLIVWTNVAVGSYQLRATATDNLGATGTSSVVNITVVSHPLMVAGPIVFNRQTGLFEQAVRVTNPSPIAFNAVCVLVRNLRAAARVWNASGKTNGVPFVQYNLPVAAGGSVDLVIEYYDPERIMPEPVITAEVAATMAAPNQNGTSVRLTRQMFLADGTFLLEFNSLSDRNYFVQYSDDGVRWKTASPAITGTGTRAQWIDNGPPKTETPPAMRALRMYRLIMVP